MSDSCIDSVVSKVSIQDSRVKLVFSSIAISSALIAGGGAAHAAGNLVQNGDFEISSPINLGTYPTSAGGIGQIGNIVNLSNWSKTCIFDCAGSNGFAFVVDQNADNRISGQAYPNQGGGFPSLNTPGVSTNIFVWGPDYGPNPVQNGFTGSPNGGKFVGIDGDYGRSKITQTISSLTVGNSYTLSFEYAGSQFTDSPGATNQYWEVGVNNSTIQTPGWTNPSQGFTPWQTYSYQFTAAASSFDLDFTAVGGQGTALPPFLLLDNVQILESTPPPPTSVPGPLPVLGAGVAMGFSRRLRRRIASAKSSTQV